MSASTVVITEVGFRDLVKGVVLGVQDEHDPSKMIYVRLAPIEFSQMMGMIINAQIDHVGNITSSIKDVFDCEHDGPPQDEEREQ